MTETYKATTTSPVPWLNVLEPRSGLVFRTLAGLRDDYGENTRRYADTMQVFATVNPDKYRPNDKS